MQEHGCWRAHRGETACEPEGGGLKRKTTSECEELRRVNLGQYLHQLLIDVAEYLRNACRFDLDFLRPRAPP